MTETQTSERGERLQRWTIINTAGPFAKGQNYTVVGPRIEHEVEVVLATLLTEALEALEELGIPRLDFKARRIRERLSYTKEAEIDER